MLLPDDEGAAEPRRRCCFPTMREPMKRRDVFGVIGGAAAWPLAVLAQQPKNVPRIGFLVTGSLESPEARAILKAFDQGLREYGYIAGQNVILEVRAADLNVERFPVLASE